MDLRGWKWVFALILSLAKCHNDLERAKNLSSSVDDVTLSPGNCNLENIFIVYLPLQDFRLKINRLLK